MNWNALKNYKCPKCNSALKDIGNYHACTKTGCAFSINKQKFESIVNDKYKPKVQRDNFQDLQSLGHTEVSEGFLPDEDIEIM